MTIEEAKKKSISCVYCLTFPDGKKYVGKTKDLSSRIGLYERFESSSNVLGGAIKEFGLDSVDVSVLTELKCNDKECLELALSILEIKFIRDLDTLVPNGLNVSIGGECLGVPPEYITTNSDVINAYNNGAKVVLCYDLNGDYVVDYPSVAQCAYDNGVEEKTIRHYIGKMKPFADKWYLRYKRYDYIPNKIEVPVWEVRERVKYKDVIEERVVIREKRIATYVPALKYDMNGNFCGEFSNKSDACRTFLNGTHCGWGEYKNGYILFKKVCDDYPKKIEDYTVLGKKQLKEFYVPAYELEDKTMIMRSQNNPNPLCVNGKYTNINNTFPVAQYTLDGKLVKIYPNMRDAASETGVAYSGIWACVKGTAKKSRGYVWRRADEDNPVELKRETKCKKDEKQKKSQFLFPTIGFKQILFNFVGE